MRLIIFRHGEAGVAQDDHLRQLTDRGVADVRRVACSLVSELEGADALTSPYIRARQTCDEIAANTELRTYRELNLITPDDDPNAVLAWLQDNVIAGCRDEPNTVLLVSHQPLASRLISILVDGREGGFYPMATASAALLEVNEWLPGMARIIKVIHAADLE